MKLYICMVMGGSICTLLYIFFNCILPYEFGLGWKKVYLNINIIFHLLPIPLLTVEMKQRMKEMFDKAGINFRVNNFLNTVYTNDILNSIVVRDKYGRIIYLTGYQNWLPFILFVAFIFFILIAGWVILYLIMVNRYKQGIVYFNVSEYTENVRGMIRKVRMGVSPQIQSPVTVGILKPVILFPLNNDKYAASMNGILRHELKHILNMDAFFRFLTFIIIALEWYNPLTYYLLRENIAVSEMICDEAAVKGMTKKEKIKYMDCIVESVGKTKGPETIIVAIGKTNGLSKERMKKIMGKNEKKIWKKSITVGIIIFCFLSGSIPAFAYNKPQQCIENNYTSNVVETWKQADMVLFMQKDITENEAIDFNLGSEVFISETGEVYYYEDSPAYNQKKEKLSCPHNYVEGTYSKHYLNDDNSCKVVNYNAQRCTKCGNIVIGEEISTFYYNACPHK